MGRKRMQVLHDGVEPELEWLEGQPKLFASGNSLQIPECYQSLHKVECGAAVQPRPIGHLPQGERGLRRRERLQDAESVNQRLRAPVAVGGLRHVRSANIYSLSEQA